jgi:hypothetical protein
MLSTIRHFQKTFQNKQSPNGQNFSQSGHPELGNGFGATFFTVEGYALISTKK